MSKVFLSSTWVDLLEHRRAVIGRLDELRHQGYAVEWLGMEGFAAQDEAPADTCRRFVEQADAYVGIFGVRYGSRPPGSVRSMTEIEYRHAVKLNKPRLLFLIDEEHASVKPVHYEKDPDRLKRLRRFKKDVLKERTVRFFTTPEDLAGKVVTALMPYLDLRAAPGRRVDIEALRRDYLAYLSEDCRWLDFRGILQMREVVRLPTERKPSASGRRCPSRNCCPATSGWSSWATPARARRRSYATWPWPWPLGLRQPKNAWARRPTGCPSSSPLLPMPRNWKTTPTCP
jgi:hypothetical protein